MPPKNNGPWPWRSRLSLLLRGAFWAALAPVFLAPLSLGAEPGPARPAVYAAYVLLAESPAGSTSAFARVIVDPGRECPALIQCCSLWLK